MRIDLLCVLVGGACAFFGMTEPRATGIDKAGSSMNQNNANSEASKAKLLGAPTVVTLQGKKITATSDAYVNAMPGIPDKDCKSSGGIVVPVTLTSSPASSLANVSITKVWLHSGGVWWSVSVRPDDTQASDIGKRVVGRGCRDGIKDGMQVDTIVKLTEDNQTVYLRIPPMSLSSVH